MEFSQNIKIEDYIIPDEFNDKKSLIYGEVDCKELAELFKKYNLLDRMILDIGSGCGKIVIYMAYKFNIMIDGIEISKNRYDKSVKLYNKYQVHSNVYLYHDNFKNIYLGNYDVLYCCNLVFSEEDNNSLYDKILKEFSGYLFLFNYNHKIKRFMKGIDKIKTSWNKQENIFIFYL